MHFLDSYYSVTLVLDGNEKIEYFKDNFEEIRFRREKAINYFFNKMNELKNCNPIISYRIEFIFMEHNIERENDHGELIYFDRFQKNILFSISDNKIEINFYEWGNEASRGNKLGALFFGKEVCVIDLKGNEIWVYDDKICKSLGLDYRYHEWE